jgi:hypothetical protein
MNTLDLVNLSRPGKACLVWILSLPILIGASVLASSSQKNFGRVEVSNLEYRNFNGIGLRGNLFNPAGVSPSRPAPEKG